VRVPTAFNKRLEIRGASVGGVSFTEEGIVVSLRWRRRKYACLCGEKTQASYDRTLRRWRHLGFGSTRSYLEAEIVRIDSGACRRVRTEEVSWARPGSRHTRDFQAVICYLTQRADKTTICRPPRVSFEAVPRIVQSYVAEQLEDTRLEHLYRIGVDEVSYRKGHRYLTVVADRDRSGAVVWVKEGRDAATLSSF